MNTTLPPHVDERKVVGVTVTDDTPKPATGTPTQISNPSRASWRTFVQSIIPTLAVLNLALPLIYGFLVDNAADLSRILGPVYGWITIGVNTAAVAIALLAKLNAVIMANPRINAFITNGPWWISWLAPIKAAK